MIWIQCNMDIFSINHTHIKSTQMYYKPRILTMSLWKKYKGTWLWLLLKDSAHKKFFFLTPWVEYTTVFCWPDHRVPCCVIVIILYSRRQYIYTNTFTANCHELVITDWLKKYYKLWNFRTIYPHLSHSYHALKQHS